MTTVVLQQWEEVEVGWGERPDGYSLHFEDEDLQEYIRTEMARQDEFLKTSSSRDYSRPVGKPYRVEVDDATVKAMREGHRRYLDPMVSKYPKAIEPSEASGYQPIPR